MVYFSAGEISDSARVLVLCGSILLKHTTVTRAKMIPLNQVCPSTNTRREGAFVASNNEATPLLLPRRTHCFGKRATGGRAFGLPTGFHETAPSRRSWRIHVS